MSVSPPCCWTLEAAAADSLPPQKESREEEEEGEREGRSVFGADVTEAASASVAPKSHQSLFLLLLPPANSVR